MVDGLVLCMIVKDEALIIERALRSVRPHIAAYAIADTGSSDDTIVRVVAALNGLPGQIISRPWKDFSSNRNEALELARDYGTHAVILDADEELRVPASGFPALDPAVDLYWMVEHSSQAAPSMSKPRILRLATGYGYEGVIHEAIRYSADARHADLREISVLAHYDGARSKGLSAQEKYLRDAQVLEQAVASEPLNSRSWYYLGLSYLAGQVEDRALNAFEHLMTLDALPSERYDARMRLAQILRKREQIQFAEMHLREASKLAPHRSDPLVLLAEMALGRGEFAISHALALRALEMPVVNDGMFIDTELQFPRRHLVFLNAARAVGDLPRARQVVENVLRQPNLTERAQQIFSEWKQRLAG